LARVVVDVKAIEAAKLGLSTSAPKKKQDEKASGPAPTAGKRQVFAVALTMPHE
jgi:hypothetical protein